MKYAELAKVLFFYLLIGAVVLFSPLGPVPSYAIIIALSLGFMFSSGIKARPGNPLSGLVAGSLAMIAVFIVILVAGGLAVKGIKTDAALALLWGAVLQIFVATGEELSFRHYIFDNLDRATGRRMAAAISSLGFAAMHLPSLFLQHATPVEFGIALATIFIASLTLTVLYLKAGILAAIGFHFAWNFLQYNVFGFSYMMDAALEITRTGSDLLTGGIFGPEASLPGLIVMAATLIAVWYYYSWKERRKPELKD